MGKQATNRASFLWVGLGLMARRQIRYGSTRDAPSSPINQQLLAHQVDFIARRNFITPGDK